MYSQAKIDRLVREVKALKEPKCPFCGEHLEVDEDSKKEKIFHCQNYKGFWVYNKETKRMFRKRR